MNGTASIISKSISSIATLLIGLFIFVVIPSQIDIPEGSTGVTARTVPYIISSAIIILSLFIIASNVINARKVVFDNTTNDEKETTSYGRVFLAFIAITAWIIVLPYLGYNIATILLVASVMLIIGNCRWWQIVILSLVLSVPINKLLALVLKVYLPGGSLFGL